MKNLITSLFESADVNSAYDLDAVKDMGKALLESGTLSEEISIGKNSYTAEAVPVVFDESRLDFSVDYRVVKSLFPDKDFTSVMEKVFEVNENVVDDIKLESINVLISKRELEGIEEVSVLSKSNVFIQEAYNDLIPLKDHPNFKVVITN